MLRHASIQTIIAAIALAVFWIACVSTLHLHEMILGVGAVLFSCAAFLFTVRMLSLHFAPPIGSLIQCWRLPWYILSDSFEIVQVLARDLVGRRSESHFRSTPYRYVSQSSFDIARRVLATAYTNVGPNFIVIGIDDRRRQMLFHQLSRTGIPVMTRRLGAESGK